MAKPRVFDGNRIRHGSRPRSLPVDVEKPPYAVPLMAAIRRKKSNGYKVVSTFTGAGGSCLGFQMAGFRCVYATEFIESARDTYAANFPRVPIDHRDIRHVGYDEILDATRLAQGELDVLEGSPPCASFSLSGKREQDWGAVKPYSETKQRTDDLFEHFVRIAKGLRPRVVVAENVKGLIVGKAVGYFLETFEALEAAGYRVNAQVLDAQWLGVPQRRQRIIFMGVREDLGIDPVFPKPLSYVYSVRDALPWLEAVATRDGRRSKASEAPAPTIQTHGRRRTRSELSAVGPALAGTALAREAERLAPGESSERYFNLIRPHPDEPCPTITQVGGSSPGTASVIHPDGSRKFSIPELKRLCSFPDDFELTGTYQQQWERCGRAVPPIMMRAIAERIRDGILRRADE